MPIYLLQFPLKEIFKQICTKLASLMKYIIVAQFPYKVPEIGTTNQIRHSYRKSQMPFRWLG